MNVNKNPVRQVMTARTAGIATTKKRMWIAVGALVMLLAATAVITSGVLAQKPSRLIEMDQDERLAVVKPTPPLVSNDINVNPSITIEALTPQEKTFDISADRIDSVIANQAGDKSTQEIIRVFSGGILIDNPALAFGLIPKSGRFSPDSRSLVVIGNVNGNEVLEDIRFLELDQTTLLIVRDVYLDGPTTDISIGRGLPFHIQNGNSSTTDRQGSVETKSLSSNYALAATAPQPTLSSISGFSSCDAGITNGKVNMRGVGCANASPCGTNFDGYYAINDQPGSYRLTLVGNNFGSNRGTVTLAGASVPIVSWSNTSILIDPTVSAYSGPLCAVLKITTASGVVLNSGLNIVPAIRTRIFGQCTFHVALTRLQMGMQPSPTAYSNYSTITPAYVPRPGDQYQWAAGSGKHTAIVIGVSGPVQSTGGIKTWTLTISQQNADCRNTISTYTTQFQTKTTGTTMTVTAYPKASYGNYYCSVYWR